MNQIYTAGYSGHTPAQLKTAADQLGAYVIDIRYSARSRQPGWDNKELSSVLGSSYLWCSSLGNVNHATEEEIQIADAALGLWNLRRWRKQRPLILLCGCADYLTCHRREIARLLGKDSIETQELEWPTVEQTKDVPGLSLWQPWATLIAIGAKQIETRKWATNYRGPLAIHAAKNLSQIEVCRTLEFSEHLQGWVDDWDSDRLGHHLPLGAIVAVANLVDCVPITGELADSISEQERNFGDYREGRFAWILEDVRRLKEPISQRGAQKLFNVTLPDSVMKHIALAEQSQANGRQST